MGRTAPEFYVNGPYGWGGYIEGYSGSDTNLIIPALVRNNGNTLNDIDVSECPDLWNLDVEGNAFSATCREAIRQHPNWTHYWVY